MNTKVAVWLPEFKQWIYPNSDPLIYSEGGNIIGLLTDVSVENDTCLYYKAIPPIYPDVAKFEDQKSTIREFYITYIDEN